MSLDRILHRVYAQPWCILPAKHRAIQAALEAHLSGASLADFATDEQAAFEIVGSVAVVAVAGVILNKASGLETMCGAVSLDKLRGTLRELASDDAVQSIILNISSGGGIITGVPETADLIAQIATAKPVYAYTNEVIASAAYWLASQCSGIFLSKSAEIGSIGVYMALIDSSKAFEKQGLKVELFKAGKYKATGLQGTSLSEEDKARLQASVDKAYADFTGYVTAKRTAVQLETMQGQCFTCDEALANGLADGRIDELGSLVAYLNR